MNNKINEQRNFFLNFSLSDLNENAPQKIYEKILELRSIKNIKIEIQDKNLIIKSDIIQPILLKIEKSRNEILISDDHNIIYEQLNESTLKLLNQNDNVYSFNLYVVEKNKRENKKEDYEIREESGEFFKVYYDKKLKFGIMKKNVDGDLILLDPSMNYTIDLTELKIVEEFNRELIPTEIIENIEDAKSRIKEKFVNYFETIKKSLKMPIVLFSGGVDSSSIALMLKKLGLKPLLISLGVKNMPNKDLEVSKDVAKFLGLELIEVETTLEEIENAIKDTIMIIGSKTTTKIEVGLVGYLLLKHIKEKLNLNDAEIFTGLGSEEIFAGYERHKSNPFLESIAGTLNIYHRDVYRDYRLIKHFGFKPMLPFLDNELIREALKVRKFKIYNGFKKYIFRLIAKDLGLEHFAFRKKLAAQYGSSISKALQKLTKKNGFKYKKDYIKSLISI